MRYKEVHIENLKQGLDRAEKDLADIYEGKSIFHIGCLTGKLIAKIGNGSSGCEDYAAAKKYARGRNKVEIHTSCLEIPDKSYDVVIIDPDYYSSEQDVLIGEGARIARETVVYGRIHDGRVPEELENCGVRILNDKYEALDIRVADEHSDSSEE